MKNRRWSLGLILGALIALAPAISYGADGKGVWEKKCKTCHGDDGHGVARKAKILKIDPKLLDLARPDVGKLTKDQIHKVVMEGKKKMPAYGKRLSPEDLNAVVDYVNQLIAQLHGKAASST